MERGYVKLFRSIDQNELLENDNTALVVFIKLLTRVDRRTGSYKTGRFKFAHICNMKPSTLRDALKRLEATTIIRQQADSKATTIYICNWGLYQQSDDSAPSVQRRADDTKQEKKEKKNKDTIVSTMAIQPKKMRSKDIDEMFEYWEKVTGTSIDGNKQRNRYACSNLLKSQGKEGLERYINGVVLSHTAPRDTFPPRIYDFISLQEKLDSLKDWGKRVNNTGKRSVSV